MCWKMEFPIKLIVVLVLRTTMFVTGGLSLRAICCVAYSIYRGSWCCRTNVCVTGIVSLEPRCYVVVYLSWSSGEFTSTSSHMCGNRHLPIFLFRDGSVTLMRIASLMNPAIFWSSLPTLLKLPMDISWPVVL